MEVYILDSLLRRDTVVDWFDSMIWTERWTDLGDFELDIASTPGTRSMFIPGTRLAMNQSYRIMTVDSVEDATATDGKKTLKVKGHSLEALLRDRVATNALAAVPAATTTTNATAWSITDTPAAVARTMFDQICRNATLNLADKIPFLQPGNLFPVGTIAESSVSITWQQNNDTLFNAIKAVCDKYTLGFRLLRNFDTSQLYFEIYAGDDRTTSQTVLNPVVFSPNLDNLQNTTELTITESAKNVAYVFGTQGFQIVFPPDVAPDISGLDRHVLLVNAPDLQLKDVNGNPLKDANGNAVVPTSAQITAYLTQLGQEELAKNRGSTMFDGELNKSSNAYVYDVDYRVGDLVEMRNQDGVITKRRVTEQIFVCDAQGDRAYPTLAAGIFDGTSTWLLQKSKAWADYDSDTTSTWSTQA